jgi:hypothetical protein
MVELETASTVQIGFAVGDLTDDRAMRDGSES